MHARGGEQYRMHARLLSSQGNYNALISALLSAYTTQQTLKYVFVSDEGAKCSPSHILKLDMIEFTDK